MAVVGVINDEPHPIGGPEEQVTLLSIQSKANELHCADSFLVALSGCKDAGRLRSLDLKEDGLAAVDAMKSGDLFADSLCVLKLNQHGGGNFIHVWKQGIVGIELVLDCTLVDNALRPHHFLNLGSNSLAILEDKRHEGADRDASPVLQLDDPGAKAGTLPFVLGNIHYF